MADWNKNTEQKFADQTVKFVMTPELCRIMQNYKINIKLGIDVKLIILHI